MHLVGGGCGHRDSNSAQTDIVVNYSGPSDSNPTSDWVCRIDNKAASSRALRGYAICASASSVTGP
jgi:hypothetical protein